MWMEIKEDSIWKEAPTGTNLPCANVHEGREGKAILNALAPSTG